MRSLIRTVGLWRLRGGLGDHWWPKEIPSREDFENACRNLDRVCWKVDYVISHTCPVSQRILFGGRKHLPDPTETMLQELWDRGLEFGAWHFGHFHLERRVDKFVCHYNKVEPLGGVMKSEEEEKVRALQDAIKVGIESESVEGLSYEEFWEWMKKEDEKNQV